MAQNGQISNNCEFLFLKLNRKIRCQYAVCKNLKLEIVISQTAKIFAMCGADNFSFKTMDEVMLKVKGSIKKLSFIYSIDLIIIIIKSMIYRYSG